MLRKCKTSRSTSTLSALAAVLLIAPGIASAFQPDAPFQLRQQKNKDLWAAEDEQIDAKLTALEQTFGKKPNIIYILADDVGWGELG